MGPLVGIFAFVVLVAFAGFLTWVVIDIMREEWE